MREKIKMDRAIFMDQGQIIEENTPKEFYDHPESDRLNTDVDKRLKIKKNNSRIVSIFMKMFDILL
jgi:ABC-type sulfate/molybdate transport systems ATPase subunit